MTVIDVLANLPSQSRLVETLTESPLVFPFSVDMARWEDDTLSCLHVLMHLGDDDYEGHLCIGGERPSNACVMPVFWYNETYLMNMRLLSAESDLRIRP